MNANLPGIAFGLLAVLAATAGCGNMKEQPVPRTLEQPVPPPAGAVARDAVAVGKPPVTLALLERGRERYAIYCTPCHGEDGAGAGIVVRRGFPAPPSFHAQRLRDAPDEHLVDVISRGYGTMYSYASRVSPADRWAIAGYIRALQRSRNATLADVPADERVELTTAGGSP